MDDRKVYIFSNISTLRKFGTTNLCALLVEGQSEVASCIQISDDIYMQILLTDREPSKEYPTFTSLLEELKGKHKIQKGAGTASECLGVDKREYLYIRGETERVDYRAKSTARVFSVGFFYLTKEKEAFFREKKILNLTEDYQHDKKILNHYLAAEELANETKKESIQKETEQSVYSW